MIADTQQLARWHALLEVPTDADTPIAAALSATLLTAQGRSFLVAAAAAADLLRGPEAEPMIELPPLASMPTRWPASKGSSVADAVWTAYLRTRQGDAAAADWMRSFIATLAPTALVVSIDDNPEPWWQNEMVILHAVHSFALRSGDEAMLERSLECADFHLREIQPDHATNEPWAVHAYASHLDGNVTAETLLHAGYIQHAGALGPTARHLARDAAAALAVFLKA